MTILLLEDQGIIAFELVDALERRGYVTKPFATVKDAESWLEQNWPLAAVVDCILNDGDCSHLVMRLRRGNIPVIVYTGRDPSDLGLAFDGLKIFSKPSSADALIRAMEESLDPAKPS